MPTPHRPPKYRHYKPKDLAVVRIDGKDHYLGRYDSPESWREYYRLVSDHLSAAERTNLVPDAEAAKPAPIGIGKLCLLYFEFAESEYVRDGKPTHECNCIRYALRRVLKLFADLPAASFTPKCLKMVRDELIRDGQARKTANSNTSRIQRMFRWGVEQELVPAATYQALMAVTRLKRGRTTAAEPKKVMPVTEADVEAILSYLPPAVRTMVQVQRLSGCRPGEICILRPCDIDRTADVWYYRPHSHKTEQYDVERRILLGPQAQKLLAPWLARPKEQYCFSPQESEEFRRRQQSLARKTPQEQGNRPGTNRRPKPKRRPGVHYTTASYRRAIERACIAAHIKPWKPNQLRHQISQLVDLDAARIILGHTDARVTEIYAAKDFSKAADLMRVLG